MNYDAIPGVVYTCPEVATVGKTEEELKAAGVAYKVGKFPFTANGRARAILRPKASSKSSPTPRPTACSACISSGPMPATMIAEAVLAMEFGASSEDIARTCHAHPTLNEAVKEAALAVSKRAINF